MQATEFRHLNMSMVKDVAVVEISTKEVHDPNLGRELASELAMVAAQEWAQRLLINFRRVTFLNSTGFAAIFHLVREAQAEGRQVKLCGMEHGVLLGAEIVGLQKVVEIHNDEASALRAFAQT
jgi:anti-sigma B factor antagonist